MLALSLPTPPPPMPGLEDAILDYRRSSLKLKPQGFKIALQCPETLAWEKIKPVMLTPRTGITAHGLWPYGTVNNPVLDPTQLRDALQKFNHLYEYWITRDEMQQQIMMQYWPNLWDTTSYESALGFHRYEAEKHIFPYDVPIEIFLQLPIHFARNLPEDLGISDKPRTCDEMYAAVRATMEKYKSSLAIGSTFQIDSKDVELHFSEIKALTKEGLVGLFLKEVRFRIDSDISRTLPIPAWSKFTGALVGPGDVVQKRSEFPPWALQFGNPKIAMKIAASLI